jgi:hypothetical protein
VPRTGRQDRGGSTAQERVVHAVSEKRTYRGMRDDLNAMGAQAEDLLPGIKTGLLHAASEGVLTTANADAWIDWAENFSEAQTATFEKDIQDLGDQLQAAGVYEEMVMLFDLKVTGRQGRKLLRSRPLARLLP